MEQENTETLNDAAEAIDNITDELVRHGTWRSLDQLNDIRGLADDLRSLADSASETDSVRPRVSERYEQGARLRTRGGCPVTSLGILGTTAEETYIPEEECTVYEYTDCRPGTSVVRVEMPNGSVYDYPVTELSEA